MFEYFSATDDRKDLAAALVRAQTHMGAAVKDSKNPHFRSSYASLTAVIHAVVPVLNAQGIAVLQMPHIDEEVVQLTTTLLHTSGQMISSTVGTPMGKKKDAQAVGSAITYLRRYSLQSIMGLPVEDDDGNAASQRPVSHRTSSPQRPARTVPSTAHSWAQKLVKELQDNGLTVDDFNVWADGANRPPLGALDPTRAKMAHAWVTDSNGIAVIREAITNPVK